MRLRMDELKDLLQKFKYDVSDCGVRVYSRINPNKIPKTDHPINKIRFNVAYRADSVVWHIELLINQRKVIASNMEKTFPECLKNPMDVIWSRKHQFYIFDDIIFNILSVFDYLACMIGVMFRGRYLRWNNLVRSASDKNNDIGKYSFASSIVEIHENWVDSLMGFRSDLIHQQSHFGDAKVDISFEKKEGLNRLLSLAPPDKINKIVKTISPNISADKLDIIDCSILLAKEVYVSGSNLLNKIQ